MFVTLIKPLARLHPRAWDFVQLVRLDRPIGIYLLLWPTLWSLWIAADGVPELKNLLIFVLGVILMRAAGCVINDFADRNFDGHVARTKARPLATGKISVREAWITFAVLVALSFGLVLLTNATTVWLSFGAVAVASLYPFMKRYSKAYLARHPEKKGQDLATTRKACAKFSRIPVAVFNFLEGTRFTRAKHDEQQSPFRHLLKPKAGGIAFVLDAMGEQLKTLVNVTIHYPDGSPTFWCLLSGRLKDVVVRFEELEIPRQFVGKSYDQDAGYRAEFQQWVNQLWERKDQLLDSLHREFPGNAKA
ncbi:hypothetical protein ALP65_00846 [Pseudomonas aeruginosa]|uniref:4-hydroxybenzoate octaprenyltransferase n=1 Tax=Pseudomonas aeruginosa TaxID=287 RepID=A0A3M5DN74_PSEAI|nr:hypothetical protein ALP65_00846 [Pseudomonas aeruginosa]